MRVIGIGELGGLEDLEIKELFAMRQQWRDGHTFYMRTPRKQNALLWFCGAEGLFTIKNGRSLSVPRGALVLIPQGAEYALTFLNCEKVTTLLLEFCLFSHGEPFVPSDDILILDENLSDRRIKELLLELYEEYKMPTRPYLSLRSGFYRLLSMIATREERRLLGMRGFRAIEKGIHYLETDADQSLSIEEIAEMCFVSPAYFRRLFHEYAGVSPAAYRTRRRIERAKELMDRSDVSIAELSDLLGYDNPSYFCRVFKKETGIAPSEYRRWSIEK